MDVAQYQDDKVRKNLLRHYKKSVLAALQPDRPAKKQRMLNLTMTYLCEAKPALRLCQEVARVLQQNIQANPNWDVMAASVAIEQLEKYAWNLIDFGWKKELRTIKVYSGFYKTNIEAHLGDAQHLFSLLGYHMSANSEQLIIDRMLSHQQLQEAAFEFYLGSVDCLIYNSILTQVGRDITLGDVHRCHSLARRTVDECVRLLSSERHSDGKQCTQHNSGTILPAFNTLKSGQSDATDKFADENAARGKRHVSGQILPSVGKGDVRNALSDAICCIHRPATQDEHILSSMHSISQPCAVEYLHKICRKHSDNTMRLLDVVDGGAALPKQTTDKLTTERLLRSRDCGVSPVSKSQTKQLANENGWTCGYCTFTNKAECAYRCESCNLSRTEAEVKCPDSGSPKQSTSLKLRGNARSQQELDCHEDVGERAPDENGWNCQYCTFRNQSECIKCESCDNYRASGDIKHRGSLVTSRKDYSASQLVDTTQPQAVNRQCHQPATMEVTGKSRRPLPNLVPSSADSKPCTANALSVLSETMARLSLKPEGDVSGSGCVSPRRPVSSFSWNCPRCSRPNVDCRICKYCNHDTSAVKTPAQTISSPAKLDHARSQSVSYCPFDASAVISSSRAVSSTKIDSCQLQNVWQCSRCTLANQLTDAFCNACNSPRIKPASETTCHRKYHGGL